MIQVALSSGSYRAIKTGRRLVDMLTHVSLVDTCVLCSLLVMSHAEKGKGTVCSSIRPSNTCTQIHKGTARLNGIQWQAHAAGFHLRLPTGRDKSTLFLCSLKFDCRSRYVSPDECDRLSYMAACHIVSMYTFNQRSFAAQ